MEVRTEQLVIKVELYCDSCGGLMKKEDGCLLSSPPQYVYTCTDCSNGTVSTKIYPYTEYENRNMN